MTNRCNNVQWVYFSCKWTCRKINSLHIVASVGHSIEYYDARNNKYKILVPILITSWWWAPSPSNIPNCSISGPHQHTQVCDTPLQIDLPTCLALWTLLPLYLHIGTLSPAMAVLRGLLATWMWKQYIPFQDRLSPHYITLRQVGVVIFAVQKQWVFHLLRVCM